MADKPNFTILVVDDSRAMVQLIGIHLKNSNFTVHTAFDGAQALTAVKENTPDLILMDWDMPVMSGIDAIKAIHEMDEGKYKNIPIVIVTAKGQKEDVLGAVEVGARDYLVKPISKENLLKKINAILGIKR